jgi:apolipoprotein D and lipocalin family protein
MNLQCLPAALAVVLAGATVASLVFTGVSSVQAAEATAIASAPVSPPVATLAPLAPIASLDLTRYMGRWYELARYPNRFQKQCTGAATADYTLLPKGTVQVVNRCPRPGGTVDEAIGEARRVGPEGSPTLQVRFAPAWLSFLPQVWGNYWVIELDAGYQLAVVSEPRREFLWVLSRKPSLPAAQWPALNTRLQALGFEPARLIRSAEP